MWTLLASCAVILDTSDCEVEDREVGAEDPLGDLGFTVAELLATVERGAERVDLTAPDGTIHATVVSTVARDEPALFHDATVITGESRQDRYALFPRREHLLFALVCRDEVEVPVDLHVESEGGAVVVHGPGLATSSDDLALAHAIRDLDLATESLLPPNGEGLDRATVELQYDGDGLDFVSAWWSREDPHDYEQSLEGPLDQ